MKVLKFLITILSLVNSSFAQNSFRIKIVDSDNGENIRAAALYINEMPGSDTFSDTYGVVTYKNLPSDRKVTINVKKQGYKQASIEALASP